MPFSLILFFISITGIFLSDIFANYNTSQFGFYLALSSPFFIFLLVKMEKKKIYLPIKETFFYFLFISFSTVSAFFAIDREMALQGLLTYIVGYPFFIFVFNYQRELMKSFKWFLISISIFSCFLFLINKIFVLKLFSNWSFFYEGFFHNELGNFLVLGIIICLYEILFNYKNKLKYALFLILPFFILSYSRTAYLSVIVISILFLFIKNSLFNFNKKIILLNIILVGVIIFFNTTKEVNKIFPDPVRNFLEKRLLLPKGKSLTGKRQQHYYYTWLTILERPLFGVGPNNLYFSTIKKQFNDEEATTTAHNLFLDILAENGAFAVISFLFFLTFAFIKMKKDLYYYLFLSLSLVFLFDFSYKYISVFLFWMILMGISTNNNKSNYWLDNKVFFLLITAIFFIGQLIMIGKIFTNIGLADLSLKIYPLNSKGYEALIKQNISKGEYGKGIMNLRQYDNYFENDYISNYKKGMLSIDLNDKKSAVYYYEKALYNSPLLSLSLLDKIFALNIDILGKKTGKLKTEEFIIQFKKKVLIPKKSDVETILKDFCFDNNLKCQ
ncbi:MAG: O-antigen ligase family protein [Patescibacteria group bacterium]|jgi:O-antigen ligase